MFTYTEETAKKRIYNDYKTQLMKTIKIKNTNVSYKDLGAGETTLLFVHGSFINMEYWAEQIDYFKDKYRVIAIDLPGHGLSGDNRDSWSIQEYGADLDIFIEKLNLQNIILIGHSMGGNITLEAAINRPSSVIGFVGIDNFKSAGTAMQKEIQEQFTYILEMLKTDFETTSENFARQALLSPTTEQSIVNRVTDNYKTMNKDIGYSLISDSFTYHARERELLQKLNIKIYLINVNNQPTDEKLLQKHASSGHHIFYIEGSCHFPMIENPTKFNTILNEIIFDINKQS